MLRDLLERAVRAFLAAFVGTLTAGHAVDLSTLRSLGIAGVAAGVSAVLSVVAGVTGVAGSASLDPKNVGTTSR